MGVLGVEWAVGEVGVHVGVVGHHVWGQEWVEVRVSRVKVVIGVMFVTILLLI